ncbi:D-dopachrome decarboxylase-like [Dermacentor silvarum]|uniref:D-dopachrome decarboxylase-like n=1 Tax=Dermacentor silvarum TaxID=543639 RepID=UPI001899F41D|nr:D-dopachrome decarboxylase-like [Dermacentor silvarum]XP_049519606.1 D-dopachrome decarboxylase-like [Dermacentor silvarum]
MPLCTLKTNLLASKIPNGFNVRFAQYVATLLKKDIEKVTVIVEPGLEMSRAGTTDPNCLCSIHSINVFSPDKNKEYGSKLRDFLSENLAMPPKRIVITLFDLSPNDLV